MHFLRDRRVLVAALAGAAIAAIAVVAFVFAMGDDGPKMCTVRFGSEVIEYPCDAADRDSRSSGTAASSDEPWWANDIAQAVYAFIGFGIPAAGGAWAFWRHRTRRQQLEAYMRRLDETAAATKSNPSEGSRALVALRQEMRASFRQGRIDDAHFLELDKRATLQVLKLRMLELDQRFPALPMGLRNQVSTLISDGSVSDAEVNLVRGSLASQLIPGRVRDELLLVLEAWSRQDAGDPPSLLPTDPAGDGDTVVVQYKET